MVDKIQCPYCHNLVEISEALKHELEEQLEQLKKDTEVKVLAQTREKFAAEMKNTQAELTEAHDQNKRLIDQLTEMNKSMREMKRRDEKRALEMEKKLAQDEEKIRLEVQKQLDEEQHLKNLENEKKLTDALKVNEELRRKLQQGSQQTQGEVMELDLEQMLREEFANDRILPVAKGVRGADIVQEVWDKNGNKCGTILWESKNAKWSDGWISKLKEDQRQQKAEVAVLACENMPEGSHGMTYAEGVWVVARVHACPVAYSLRGGLIQMAGLRRSMVGKSEKADVLFNYMSGTMFRQRIEAVVEAFSEAQEEMERERRWFTTKWSRQEKSLRKVIDNMQGMYGDLQGIMGGNSLPEMKSLSLESGLKE